jgi:serine/threonine protein kinase
MVMLHMLQIIHKDIKPANILYSDNYNKIVLCDYGISHIVK